MAHVVGVDPGLVHTGVVSLLFERAQRKLHVESVPIVGPDAGATQAFIEIAGPPGSVFIEDYKPRSHFSTDARMTEAVRDMRAATGGVVLNNTGVKKVVRQPLMELLGVWKFSTVTHHQDLRSAARIALLGMLKDPHMNRLLFDVVLDHIEGRTWRVHT